jgi:Tol biopolymer transport system component
VLLQSNGADPQYSPDGSRIAFRRGAGPTSIMVMNADGSNVQTVTSGNMDFYPEWTDNNTLIFARLNIAQTDERIFSIEVGLPTSLKQLTPNEPGIVRFPSMSPDLKTLVFTANVGLVLQDMQSGLHTIIRPAPVAPPYSQVGSQAGSEWSPDGTKILYTSGNNTNAEIWFLALPQPATPAERAEQLSTGIESLIADGLVDAADGAQLMDKLSIVADMIAGGQLNSAVNHVNSFINKVNALVNSRRLGQIPGQQLTSEANLLITQLQSYQP